MRQLFRMYYEISVHFVELGKKFGAYDNEFILEAKCTAWERQTFIETISYFQRFFSYLDLFFVKMKVCVSYFALN